jgi:hypothetical protein
MRTWILTALLLAPTTTFAAGFGASYGIGDGGEVVDLSNLLGGHTGWVRRLPSFDLRFDPVIVQVYPLDLMAAVADEDFVLTSTVLFDVHRAEFDGGWEAVIQPGALVSASDFGAFNFVLAGTARLGVEGGAAGHVGVYVAPSVGLGIFDGEAELVTGGRLEVSVWFDGPRAGDR